MAQQSPHKRSFGPAFRTLTSTTISPIPEEPYPKELHTEGSPAPSNRDDKNETKPSKSSSPKKPIVAHQSFMFQNGPSSILSPTLKAPDSVIYSSSKPLKKFGTFAGEPSKKGVSGVISPTNTQNSDKVTMRILDKDDWVIGVNCNLCKRDFKTINGVFQHHCRVCGMAVCGECSSKKINDNRVCDMCYYKVNNPRAERRREDQLKSKDATRRTYKKQMQKEKDDLDQLIQKRYDLEKKMKEDKEEQVKAIGSLQKERDKATEIQTQKKITNLKLKETLAVDKNFLKEKESEFDELRNKINALKVQIGQKKTNYELKKEELTRLVRQMKRYEDSPSFINLLNTLPPNDTDSVVHDMESSTVSIVGLTSNKAALRRDLTKI